MLRAMIRQPNGQALLFIGFEEVNIQQLREGKPIQIRTDALGFTGQFDLIIHYRPTRESLEHELESLIRELSLEAYGLDDVVVVLDESEDQPSC